MRRAIACLFVVGFLCAAGAGGLFAGGVRLGGRTAACASSQLALIGGAAPAKGTIPVVFVHGVAGSPAIWQKPELDGSSSIADRVAAIYGTTVWAFDYHQRALEWVTDPTIGPSLANSISCLARLTGKRVVVVDHSMGGLAAQLAASQADGQGGTTASHIAEVIAIGTPFEGSKLLTVIQKLIRGGEARSLLTNPGLTAAAEALLSACAGLGVHQLARDAGNPCGLLAVLRTSAGAGLEYRSNAIHNLPAWPADLAVKPIVGEIKITLGVWFLRHTFDLGDVLVSEDSATAHATDGSPARISCNNTVLQLFSSSCYHGKLPSNPTVVGEVLSIVQKIVEREGPPKPPPPPTTTETTPTTTAPPPNAGFEIGDTFDTLCQVAWPTAPTRTTQEIDMTMQCLNIPSEYLLVSVAYPDPNLPVTPSTGRMRVHGKIVDIARSEYGYRYLVVSADRIDLPRR